MSSSVVSVTFLSLLLPLLLFAVSSPPPLLLFSFDQISPVTQETHQRTRWQASSITSIQFTCFSFGTHHGLRFGVKRATRGEEEEKQQEQSFTCSIELSWFECVL